jgi:DNA modification methylase
VSLYYQDESVTLYLGDCLEEVDWLTADVLVTDPPYGIAYESGQTSNARVALVEKVKGDESATVRDSVLGLWGQRPAVVFGSWRVARPASTRARLIWHKATRLPGFSTAPWYPNDEEVYIIGDGFVGRPSPTVITTDERRDGAGGYVAKSGHPTPKPVGLMEQLIAKCPPGVIADPFAGSGSTLVAARNQGRKAIGVEVDERYCELITSRLAQGVLI